MTSKKIFLRSLKRAKNRLVLQEKEMKELRWEREVLEQRFSKLEAEKDKLHKNFVSAIQEVVQKSNFKKLFLERKGRTVINVNKPLIHFREFMLK